MPNQSSQFNSVICPMCGNVNPAHAKVCRECLTRLNTSRTASMAAPTRARRVPRRSPSARAEEIRRIAYSMDQPEPASTSRRKNNFFGLNLGNLDMKTISPFIIFLALFGMRKHHGGGHGESWISRIFGE